MSGATDSRVTVLVTAMGGGGYGEQILKALRIANESHGRYRIIGADANPHCPQFALADEAVILPLAGDSKYIDAVLSVCRQFKVQAVFHGCESELKVMSAARERFAVENILLPINPVSVIDTCMDKAATSETLRRLGFDVPRFVKVVERRDLESIDWFPVVVKPAVGGGGSANCFIAQNQRELMALADYIGIEESGISFMAQEYVGTPDDEYTVGVLYDLDGNFINSIAVKREIKGRLNITLSVPNRTGRDCLGKNLVISSGISHGYVGQFPEVTAQCERIAAGLGARGAINIQCRLVHGAVKVFEINPRFSGTTSIRAMMGYNEPDILVRHHIFGEDIQPRFGYRSGLVLRFLVEEEVTEAPALFR